MIPTLYEIFRHWSEGSSVFILSDIHFDDSDRKLMDPNWIAAEEQVDIINRISLSVGIEKDTLNNQCPQYRGKTLAETMEYILSKYDGITEAYVAEKYTMFSSK